MNIDVFVTKELSDVTKVSPAPFMAMLVIGVGIGSLLAGWLSNGRVELGNAYNVDLNDVLSPQSIDKRHGPSAPSASLDTALSVKVWPAANVVLLVAVSDV